MTRRFESNSNVGPRDYNGFPREILFWVRKRPELIVEEGHDEIAGLSQSRPRLVHSYAPSVLQTRVYSQIESHDQRQDPCKWVRLWLCDGIHGDVS